LSQFGLSRSGGPITTAGIHNEAVLAFLKEHKDNPNVKDFLQKQNRVIRQMNRDSGMNYKDYLDYLEANIGDDAEFTMGELVGMLKSGPDESYLMFP
jgi:hypothetical protein